MIQTALCRRTGIVGAAIVVALLLAASLGAQPEPGAAPTALDRLLLPEAPPEDRAAAAAELVRLPAEDPAAVAALALLTDAAPDQARLLLAAIAREVQPAPRWLAPCAALARADSPLTADAVGALGSFRTREAAAALVEIVADSRPPDLKDAALRALIRLTGRDDLQPGQWRDWLVETLPLTDRQWEQRLLSNHIRRVQTLLTSTRDRDRQLADAWRQVHLLTPPDQRSDLLVGLLQSESPVLRDLGFELANREIGESRQLQPAVGHAAIALLGWGDPLVRAQAALLLDRLAPAEAQAAVQTALERETDPRAADALLRAASRWPSAVTVGPALRWINAGPALRQRAVAAAWSLLRDGLLTDQGDREAVLGAVRKIDTPALTAPACRILSTLGDETDVARVRVLLAAPEPAARAAAAEALALRADQIDTLLAAATGDATLFEPTARALRTHLHDARGYAALSRLPAPSPQARAVALAEYAATLPTVEIIRLARLASDPGEAQHLLRPLTAPERAPDPADEHALALYDEGLVLLARTAVALRNPAEAINALSLIPESAPAAEAERLTDLRAMLLLWLDRLGDAAELDASPEAYLDALELGITEPHAQAIAGALAARFPELTPEQAARLEGLRQRLAERAESPAPTEGG